MWYSPIMPLPNQPGIYQIFNTITGASYIGQARNLASRCAHHRSKLSNQKHRNKYLQRAWNKYGSKAFEFRLITLCGLDKDWLKTAEQYWVDYFTQQGEVYNLYPIVGSPLGTIRTAEHKAKIAASLRGRKFSNERREAISKGHLGKKQSMSSRQKQSATIKAKGLLSGSFHTRFKVRVIGNVQEKRLLFFS